MKIQNPHLYAATMLALSTLGIVAAVGIVIALTLRLGFAFVGVLCIAFILFHVLHTVYQYWFERFKRQAKVDEVLAQHARLAAAFGTAHEVPQKYTAFGTAHEVPQKYAEGGIIDPTGDVYKAAAEKIFGRAEGCLGMPGERLFGKSPLLGAPYGLAFEFRVRGKTWHPCTGHRADYLLAKFSKYYEVRSYKPTGMNLKINVTAGLPSLSAANASLKKLAAASLSAQKKAPHGGNA